MRSCTLVLVQAGDAAEPIRRLLTDWVHHRLVQPPLWLEHDGDGQLTGRWLGQHDELEEVLAAIAAEPFELIRVVNLAVDHAEPTADDVRLRRFLAASRALFDEIDAALAPGQRLVRINLAVPTTPTDPLPAEVFAPPTDPNVLIAPVSRLSPSHISTDLTTQTQPGQAAAALATVAALWTGMTYGPYDRPPESQPDPGVRVARVFGRIVQLEGALSDITEQALQRRRSEARVAQSARGSVASEPAETITETAREFLRAYGQRFSFRPPGAPSPPRQQTVSILAALAAMLRYLLRGLRELPERLVTGVVTATQDRLGRVAQELTFGSDSLVAVTFGGRQRSGSGFRPPVTDATEATAELAQQLLRQVTGESATPPAMGEAWAALRRTVFGLHDGADLPEGVTAPMDGRTRLVITDPGMLTPDPEPGPLRLSDVPAHFAPIVHAPIRPCDAFQAAQVAEMLDQGGRVPDGPERDDGSTSDGPAELSAEDRAAVLRLRAQLDAWVQLREASLLWRLCRETGDSLQAAQQALIDALNRIVAGAGVVDQGAADAAGRRLRRGWLLVTLLVLAASVGTYLLYPRLGVTVATVLIVIHVVVTLVVWVVLLLWRFARYQRQLFRLRYQHDRRHAAYVHALKTSTDLAHSVVSLASAYEQLRAWAEVVGWLLHHPEGPTSRSLQRPDASGPVATPPNVGVAVGPIGESSKRRLGALVGDELFGVGWAGELFGRYLAASMDRVRFEDGLADPPEPDWQLTRPWPLDTLLADLASGQLAEGWAQEILHLVAGHLAAIDPADVVVMQAGEPRSADGFLGEIVGDQDPDERLCPPVWTDQARNRDAHLLTQSIQWAPTGLTVVTSLGTSVGELSVVADTEVDVVTLSSLRFDATAPAHTTDLQPCVSPRSTGRADVEVTFGDGNDAL